MPLWKKEESDADSEDSEDKEIKAVQNMSKEGASAGNRVMDSDEDSEEKRTQVQAIEDKEGDNEADEEFDEEEFDGELQEEDVPEGEPLIPLGKDGKPMSEIDLYIHRAMEEKRRRRRIERAAEVEMALEKAKEEAEKGSLAGQKKSLTLLQERVQSNQMLMTSLFGIIMMMTGLQMSWNGTEVEDNNLTEGIKVLITISTIYLEYQIYQYYRSTLDNAQNFYNFPKLSLSDSPFFPAYLFEAFICALHTPPILNRVGVISDKWGLCMFVRLFIMLRIWRDNNPVYTKLDAYRSDDPNQIYQFELSTMFFVKFRFWEAPVTVVLQCLVIFFFVCVYGFYIVERELVPFVYDFKTTLWFMSVTMTTVGYGHTYTPDNILGRTFAMAAAILAMLCLAMTSAILARFIELQYREQVALGWSYRKDSDGKLRHQAAIVVQKFYRMYAVGRARWAMRRKLFPRSAHQFLTAMNNFKQTRIRYAESMVQGEGGFQLVQERIQAAEADMHAQMDCIEARVDDTAMMLMENMVQQLSKMEEMQAVVLNANFESIRKYMRTVEKKLKILANAPEIEENKSNRGLRNKG